MKSVDFYYSIGSRYSYLASTQIAELAKATSARVEWYPVNSVRLLAKRGTSPFDGKMVSGQYAWDYRELDAKRWADFYQVTYHEPRERVEFDADLLALAGTAAKQFDRVERYSYLLFAEMFHSSVTKTIDDWACIGCAESCGICAADFAAAMTDRQTAIDLDRTIDRALAVGVFGVPTFVTEGELFWGNDRLNLLRHHLCT